MITAVNVKVSSSGQTRRLRCILQHPSAGKLAPSHLGYWNYFLLHGVKEGTEYM